MERSDLGPDHQQHVRMGKLHLVDLAVRVGEKGGGREGGGMGGGGGGGGKGGEGEEEEGRSNVCM